MVDKWWFLGWFFVEFKKAVAILGSSNDNDKPLDVISGFSISNFKLGCTLFIMSWKWSAVSSLAVWR